MWDDEATIFNVVVNHEEQYSIWPVDRETPLGWKTVGKSGKKPECLAYIKEVWTDMRPLSLRKAMEEQAKHPPVEEPLNFQPARPPEAINELVERLMRPQRVEFRDRGRPESLKESVDRGYVHVTFAETKGGTELGFTLEKDLCDLSSSDFVTRKGVVNLVGRLILNDECVRCHAAIDVATFQGQGHLEYLGPAQEWRKALIQKSQ